MKFKAIFSDKPEPNKELLNEAKELFIKDGWCKLTQDFNNQMVVVLTDGDVCVRYITWESEWDEWSYSSTYMPCFYEDATNSIWSFDDNIYSELMLVANCRPEETQNSKNAWELVYQYHKENYDEPFIYDDGV